MPTTTRTPNPPPAPTRRTHKTLLTVAGAVLILIALAVTAVIAYNIGKPDHSVEVVESGTGTLDMVNVRGNAGCVNTGAHRICSGLALSEGVQARVGTKVGYAHEWVPDPGGGRHDMLVLYSLTD